MPGLNVPAGGVLPPPGVYFDNTLLLYRARQSGQVNTSLGGNVVAGIRASIWGDFLTGLWVTPLEIHGGRLALGLSVPFGEPDIRANALLSGPPT